MADDRAASAPKIREMGNKIGGLKTGIDPVLKGLNGLTVTAGDFDDAKTLETTVTQRRDDVVAFLNSVVTFLDNTKSKLDTAADDIENTEDGNNSNAGSIPNS